MPALPAERSALRPGYSAAPCPPLTGSPSRWPAKRWRTIRCHTGPGLGALDHVRVRSQAAVLGPHLAGCDDVADTVRGDHVSGLEGLARIIVRPDHRSLFGVDSGAVRDAKAVAWHHSKGCSWQAGGARSLRRPFLRALTRRNSSRGPAR